MKIPINNLEKALNQITEQAQQKVELKNLQEIKRSNYYSAEHPRSIIYSCEYQDQQAVLKVYNDPRETHEPSALASFNQLNSSTILSAPKLHAYEEINSNQGWLLTEKLPSSAKSFGNKLNLPDRQEFLQVFLEYRQNFPTQSALPLSLPEHLNSANFLLFRINRWLELASKKSSDYLLQTGQTLTDNKFLSQKLQQSFTAIREVFIDRPMIWSHGHFKGQEVFKTDSKHYYLIDFAHTRLFPQGYELGFIIWADYIMSDNWQSLTTQKWLDGIANWQNSAQETCKTLKYTQPQKLITGCLLERAWGSILADTIASEKPVEEKHQRLKLLFQLVDYCLDQI